MNPLLKKIFQLNSEGWEPGDLQELDGGRVVFQRFASALLEILTTELPEISFACMLMAGFETGVLWPVAAWPAEASGDLRALARPEGDVLHDPSNQHDLIMQPPESLHPLRSHLPFRSRHNLVVKLVGHGEFYGLIWIDVRTGAEIPAIRGKIYGVLPALSLTVAEANFSMRLQRLAAPVEWPVTELDTRDTRDEVYDFIARQVSLGFAADGAVLRIHDPDSDHLEIRGVHGQPGVDRSNDVLFREQLSRLVFDSDEDFGTVQNLLSNQSFGIEISEEARVQAREAGVVSFMILPLQSDIASAPGEKRRLGTLSVLHNRPHHFSVRDLRLAQMFVERIADDLALLDQKEELEGQKSVLEEQALMLRIQYNLITRAEVIALLAHDLGHKAIHVTELVHLFSDVCRKALRERRTPDFIVANAEKLLDACRLIEREISQIRRIGDRTDEAPSLFDVTEVIEEIRGTMKEVLDRLSMDVDIQPKGKSGLLVFGPRGVFGQAIFNLLINSVDAQRFASKQRKNVVKIHCRRETQRPSRIIIQFSDEGPGIDYHHFPKLTDIFEIGKSSKPEGQGTGTGLPVSRSLLDKYFRAELEIKERRPPLFQISVPAAANE